MDMSVVLLVGKGWDNLATASSSLFPLYKPTVVTYGANADPVTKSYTCPLISILQVVINGFVKLPLLEIILGFWE